jgi:transcriptional regulator with XRE-family HTH domain
LWQYANLEMPKIGYARRVANDDTPPNRIRELREALGLSQAELARRANVVPSTMNKLENGARGLDQDWMERLAPLLGVAPAELLPVDAMPYNLSDEEQAMLLLFRSADDTQRRQIRAMIQALLSPEIAARILRDAA